MSQHELPFGKIIILREDIAEVIINEGVEIDIDLVDCLHEFLLSNMHPHFSLLINKINSYTYSFEAQQKLGALKELDAIAVVAYNQASKIATQSIASVPRPIPWNMAVFSSHSMALTWLSSENEKSYSVK